MVKIIHDKKVIHKTIYFALGVNIRGQSELLGLWPGEYEDDQFFLNVVTDLRKLGVQDVLIICIDGIKKNTDAVRVVFPHVKIQFCTMYLVQHSVKYIYWYDYTSISDNLKTIYQSRSNEEALLALKAFCERWDDKYPHIGCFWKTHWDNINTLFNYPITIKENIYTIHAYGTFINTIQKGIKNHNVFPSDESAINIISLAIQTSEITWMSPIKNWKAVLNNFYNDFSNRLKDFE